MERDIAYRYTIPVHVYHSKYTNVLYRNYFAGLIIHCRKYFAVLNIRCTKIFAKFIFVPLTDYESILTTKISVFTVLLILLLLANYGWFSSRKPRLKTHLYFSLSLPTMVQLYKKISNGCFLECNRKNRFLLLAEAISQSKHPANEPNNAALILHKQKRVQLCLLPSC